MERADLLKLAEETGCAARRGGYVFLRDPNWGASEAEQFERLGALADGAPAPDDGWLCIPTGGTGGKLRFARHDEKTLAAAVDGFCKHFGLARVNAVSVLPAHHVSGFMARVRCAGTDGVHVPKVWRDLDAEEYPELVRLPDGWVLSLVPTQLQRLLMSGGRALMWLHQFRLIFVGGGPVWPQLTEGAARAKLPVVFSYGMTETAAMVAAQRAGDFLAGDRSSGVVMPHARVEIAGSERGGEAPHGETGLVRIRAGSLFRGYFPERRAEDFFLTEDLAFWGERGGLNIVGRRDTVIITGGKKVMPAEVAEVLLSSGVFPDVAVLGVPDAEWGQRVVACYPRQAAANFDTARIEAALRPLAKYKWPKAYVAVDGWPRNTQGKLNGARLAEEARKALGV